MAQQIILRKGTAAEWNAVGNSLILAAGEVGVETDTNKFKIGDGSLNWNTLLYAAPSTLTDLGIADGTVGQVLTTDGLGNFSFTDVSTVGSLNDLSDVTITAPASIGQVLTSDGVNWVNSALDISTDPSPTLGGNLSTAGFDITSPAAQDITIIPGTGAQLVTQGNFQVNGETTLAGVIKVNAFMQNPIGMTFDTPFVNFGTGDAGTSTTLLIQNKTYSADLGGMGILLNHVQGTSTDSQGVVFTRSRGTSETPTSVAALDRLGKIQFYGFDGTAMRLSSGIIATVDASPSGGHVRSAIGFVTDNGTTTEVRGGFTSDGVLRSNTIASYTNNQDLIIQGRGTGLVRLAAGTTVGGVAIGTLTFAGTTADATARALLTPTSGQVWIQLDNLHGYLWDGLAWVDLGVIQGPAGTNGADGAPGADGADGVDGADGAGVPVGGTAGQVLSKIDGTDYNTQWVTPSVVAALDDLTDVVITGTPSDGQVLKYDSGTSKWVNGTDSSSTVFTRQEVFGTTSSLANGATGPINITGYKSYALLKIQTSAAAWVRIYTSEAARSADASRLEGEDPLPGSGVIAEVITTGAETVIVSPATVGFNDETIPTTNIPVRVTNKSGNPAAITVTLTAIQLEA